MSQKLAPQAHKDKNQCLTQSTLYIVRVNWIKRCKNIYFYFQYKKSSTS